MLNDLLKNLQQAPLIWEKARIIPGYDSSKFRQDIYGAWIERTAYGDRNSAFGWEIDHIIPIVEGGSDNIFNLQPLHWKNNAMKSDGVLSQQYAVTSNGNRNIFPS